MARRPSWALVALVLIACVSTAFAETHGDVAALDSTCLADLNTIFNDYYLYTSITPSQDNRTDRFQCGADCRLGCRLTLNQALESSTEVGCPSQEELINCFWVAYGNWTAYVAKCELFESLVPLPACSDGGGEAAEGVPACSSTQNTVLSDSAGRRRLQQETAAQMAELNKIGYAQSQDDFGEAAGLQYDEFAPAGTPHAQPPASAFAPLSAGGSISTAEGSEGGSIAGGAVSSSSGCFPDFWTPQNFDAWLNGNYTEGPRPKDYGSVNPIGLVSIGIYTALLFCMSAF